jgi:hypothetical protein
MLRREVTINTMKVSPRVQICLLEPTSKQGPVITCRSREDAERLLLAIGLNKVDINHTFEIVQDVGPEAPISFGLRDLDETALRDNGFRV